MLIYLMRWCIYMITTEWLFFCPNYLCDPRIHAMIKQHFRFGVFFFLVRLRENGVVWISLILDIEWMTSYSSNPLSNRYYVSTSVWAFWYDGLWFTSVQWNIVTHNLYIYKCVSSVLMQLMMMMMRCCHFQWNGVHFRVFHRPLAPN